MREIMDLEKMKMYPKSLFAASDSSLSFSTQETAFLNNFLNAG